jgi:peptidoglycan/LPS O-acetylase OafA/YrhL
MFMFYFHRFYRLTPALFMGLMFFWLVTPYFSNGPYWPFYQKFVSNHCDNSWWWTLLYVQNFVDPSKLCMGWSWYLADDTQYYILSPLVLIIYWKNKWIGWALTILGILVCIACNIGIAASNGLQEFQGLEWGAEIGNYIPPSLKFGAAIYLPPWTRVSPYLVGFIFAFILLERGSQFRVHAGMRFGVYVCSSTIILILSFITYSDANYGWSEPMNIIWIGFSRPIWSIGLGALLLVCIVGYGGVFNYLMSLDFWVPLARLSYSAYLFHLSNIGIVYNGYKSGYTYEFATVLYFFMGHLLIAFALALVNFLLVEKPLMNIESLMLPRKKVTNKEG